MLRILFTDAATRQSDEIGTWGEEQVRGGGARPLRPSTGPGRYRLGREHPGRRGVEVVDGRIHYHIRHSLSSIPKADRVGSARHIVIARVVGDALWVVAYAHDGMVDELERTYLPG